MMWFDMVDVAVACNVAAAGLLAQQSGLARLTELAGNSIYVVQAIVAVIGTVCSIIVWRRLGRLRFKNEQAMDEFMQQVESHLMNGDLKSVTELCEGDGRAVPQLLLLGLANHGLGYQKVRQLLAERFQRDVIAGLETNLTWVLTAIKSAPMLGLLGTVLGMMAAFGKLAGKQPDASQLAGDISLALVTTFVGLSIAIPLSLGVSAIQVRMRKMEDLTSSGVNRFLEVLKVLLEQPEGSPPPAYAPETAQVEGS